MILATDDPLAVEATAAVESGDVDGLAALLRDHPELATARIGTDDCSRTLLHVLTDWPGIARTPRQRWRCSSTPAPT